MQLPRPTVLEARTSRHAPLRITRSAAHRKRDGGAELERPRAVEERKPPSLIERTRAAERPASPAPLRNVHERVRDGASGACRC